MASQLNFLFEAVSSQPSLPPDARKKIVEALAEKPKTQSQLFWLFRGKLTKADLMPILENLKSTGLITSKREKSGGRPRTVWSLVQ
jgi:predicted transcriptional regulator